MNDKNKPQRRRVEEMPLDHWDSERGHSNCTGWEEKMDGQWWYEYEDARTGETFLAR